MHFSVIVNSNSKNYTKSIVTNRLCKCFFIINIINLCKAKDHQASFISDNTAVFYVFYISNNPCLTFFDQKWTKVQIVKLFSMNNNPDIPFRLSKLLENIQFYQKSLNPYQICEWIFYLLTP